jgi:hypothetical protein
VDSQKSEYVQSSPTQNLGGRQSISPDDYFYMRALKSEKGKKREYESRVFGVESLMNIASNASNITYTGNICWITFGI